MVITRQKISIAIGALIIIGLGFLFLIGPIQSAITPHISYSTPYGIITVPTVLPKTPDNLTLYKVTPQPYDMAYYSSDDSEKVHPNTTSETDAPLVVLKSLERYGGLPDDAKLAYDKTDYLEQYADSIIPFFPAHVIAKYPVSTNVQYSRIIDGHQVAGDGGFINVDLGNDGELLYLDKVWRTVTPAGTVSIISASQAIERMQRGEILGMRPKCGCELTVTKIVPTYYEKGRNVSQEYLDPVWVFAGTLSDGEPWHYSVYAWESDDSVYAPKSDHFPMTPVSGIASVQANITSVQVTR